MQHDRTLDTPLPQRAQRPRPAALNAEYGAMDSEQALARALDDPRLGRLALVSSFGAESVVLLHLISRLAPTLPVLFIDTRLLFAETLAYQRDLARDLGLHDVRILRAPRDDLSAADPKGDLHRTDPDACCALRKTAPLWRALAEFDTWISGRKRYQGGARTDLEPFEEDRAGRLKFNPLAGWDRTRIAAHIATHALPRHPLSGAGYGSIGCAPCTRPASDRDGRWAGLDKSECGIHLPAPKGPGADESPVIVRDTGFSPDDWRGGFAPPEHAGETAQTGAALDLPGDLAFETLGGPLAAAIKAAPLIRVTFAATGDGRGFSLARHLRRAGFTARLRARGPLLPDQYAMARRVGYDEVEISARRATRQPQADWLARTDWRAHDYQSRLASAPGCWTCAPKPTI